MKVIKTINEKTKLAQKKKSIIGLQGKRKGPKLMIRSTTVKEFNVSLSTYMEEI